MVISFSSAKMSIAAWMAPTSCSERSGPVMITSVPARSAEAVSDPSELSSPLHAAATKEKANSSDSKAFQREVRMVEPLPFCFPAWPGLPKKVTVASTFVQTLTNASDRTLYGSDRPAHDRPKIVTFGDRTPGLR